jgi:hypothetical protein
MRTFYPVESEFRLHHDIMAFMETAKWRQASMRILHLDRASVGGVARQQLFSQLQYVSVVVHEFSRRAITVLSTNRSAQ